MTTLSTELTTGDHRKMTVGDLVQTYRDIVNISIPSQGRIQRLGANAYSLTCSFNTMDCDNLETVKTFRVYSMSTKSSETGVEYIENIEGVSDLHEVDEIVSASSENGRFQARLKRPSRDGGGDSKKQLLQIWERSKLIKTIDTSELDFHGSINTDSQFGSFVWCPYGEQDKLLYVCQPRRPKYVSFFKELPSKSFSSSSDNKNSEDGQFSSSPTDTDNVLRGEEFIRREDWGECLAGIEHTLVGILDVGNNFQVTTIDMENYSLATPQWLDNGSKIVSVAYKEDPRRLGLIYCNNRKSNIVVHDWQSANQDLVLTLEDEIYCFHTPRVNHTSDKFIYLKNILHGAHKHSVQLFIYDIRTKANKALVDDKKTDLFIEDLPKNCFTNDDKQVLLSAVDHVNRYISYLDVESRKISKIKFPTAGVTVLDFRHNMILASGFDVNVTPTLFAAAFCAKNLSDITWHKLNDNDHLNEIEYETHVIQTEDDKSFVSAIFIKPNLKVLHQKLKIADTKALDPSFKLPTVVMVHGGPHSAYTLNYLPSIVFYTKLGLQLLMINYRGSTGVSEDYIQELCGNVGKLDVEDCLLAIRHFVKIGAIDPNKLIIEGGSHGGFLSCHLSCQNEFKFTCAVMRNPVVDLASSYSTSDIPDWCLAESLGHKRFDFSCFPSKDDLGTMYDCSPISKHTKANVPTLMLLGSKDLRVKMHNGERWLDLLRARGVETMCKVYPDKHDLGKVESTTDAILTAATWILRHLP